MTNFQVQLLDRYQYCIGTQNWSTYTSVPIIDNKLLQDDKE